MNTFNSLISQAIAAGFEDYSNTYKQDFPNAPVYGNILTNTRKDSPYNGEVLDIFEDGTFTHYSQFSEAHPHYSPLKFKFS